MAISIFNQLASAAPPLDTVLLWLTTTVERDFEGRNAFPKLRHAQAKAFRGAATLHYLTADEANSTLEDAVAREQSVRRSTRSAYTAHIKNIQAAVKEAAERSGVFASADPVCLYKHKHAERWRGTKAQIRAMGIQLDGPWPREPGGKERWAKARDSRGYPTSITRSSTVWPGLFEAYVSVPFQIWHQTNAQKPRADEAHSARRNLACMPTSAHDFRAHLVSVLRGVARCTLAAATKPASWHGYTLDEDALGEIHAGFDAVAEAVVGSQINFDALPHAAIAQGHRAQIAAADTAFQSQFATLVQPNPRILEGGAR